MKTIKIFFDAPNTYIVALGNRPSVFNLFHGIIFQIGNSGNLHYQGGCIRHLSTKNMLNLDLPTINFEDLPDVIKNDQFHFPPA